MNKLLVLLLLIVLALGVPMLARVSPTMLERFSLGQSIGTYPDAQTNVLVQDSFPPIGKNALSNDDANDIWQHYPTVAVGSYDQVTNNVRHPNNPDIGRCTPASMCGALYHDRPSVPQTVRPLPPVEMGHGTRVGYFTASDAALVDALPFRTEPDDANILY